MAISGASNLFFNRDTKVYAGVSVGRPVQVAATAISTALNTYEFSTSVAHGMTTGSRVQFATGTAGAAVSNTVPLVPATYNGVIYYVIEGSTTSKFKLATTYANAMANVPIVYTAGTPTVQNIYDLDSYQYATNTATSGTNTLTLTVGAHGFAANDIIQVSGITEATQLHLNGVYSVVSVGGTTVVISGLVGLTNNAAIAGTVKISKIILWEIPVLSGYSMNQSTSTSEVTLNEMVAADGVSRRGRAMFNDALAPVEWSFDTYARPFKNTAGTHTAVEEVLWANFVGKAYPHVASPGVAQVATWYGGNTANLVASRDAADLEFNFTDSNAVTLGTFDLFFVLGGNKVANRNFTGNIGSGIGGDTTIYRVSDAVINEVSITFDIDGISTLSWSGMGGTITELGALNATTAGTLGISSNSNFIRNRLTALTISGGPAATTYGITLTGGSITISNGISFLTPEVLGLVNKPIGHVTGTRTVSGSFTCYLDEVAGGSIDLFQDLAQKGDTAITNSFSLDFYVGGGTSNVPTAPGIQFSFPTAHLEIPTINFDDVVSTEVAFHALPSTISTADEIDVIRYRGNNL